MMENDDEHGPVVGPAVYVECDSAGLQNSVQNTDRW